jgi:uncharacterized glyoxalase superfamily protein PhnB
MATVLTPYLMVTGGAEAIDFYARAFGAVEVSRAVEAGATLERPVADQPYGERTGVLVDPFGHRWFIATPIDPADR